MVVCHCEVVYDRDIDAVLDGGARDEFDIAEACGAGSICGGCVPAISALIGARGCSPRCPVPSALAADQRMQVPATS